MEKEKLLAKVHQRTIRRSRRVLTTGLVLLLAALVIHQFWPGSRNHTNPPVVNEPHWDDPETRVLAKRACFDCHSNETEWPWYTDLSIVSAFVEYDVYKGREVLNFSEWNEATWQDDDTDYMVELTINGQMPLSYYLILHPEARLSSEEQGKLVNGLIATTTK